MKLVTTKMLSQVAETMSDASKLLFKKTITDADMNDEFMEAICRLEIASREMKICLMDQYGISLPAIKEK